MEHPFGAGSIDQGNSLDEQTAGGIVRTAAPRIGLIFLRRF